MCVTHEQGADRVCVTRAQGKILLVADSGSHVVRLFECDEPCRGSADSSGGVEADLHSSRGVEADLHSSRGVEADPSRPVLVKPMGVCLGGYGLGNGRMRFPFSLAARDDGIRFMFIYVTMGYYTLLGRYQKLPHWYRVVTLGNTLVTGSKR
jgi:hypothetical protein